MRTMELIVHISAGGVALLTGALALWSIKGGRLHRKAGIIFVYAMLVMAAIGMYMAATRNLGPAVNIPAGVTVTYLVVTALTTVRPPSMWSRRLDRIGTLLALLVGIGSNGLGVMVATSPTGKLQGIPAFPFFMFGTFGLLALTGDIRMRRRIANGGPAFAGKQRIARHLWRMGAAMWIATMSFFVGQAKVFPKEVRSSGVLAIPVLAVTVTVIYYVWKYRRKGTGNRGQVTDPLRSCSKGSFAALRMTRKYERSSTTEVLP
jgi:uncharacterized membrane protein